MTPIAAVLRELLSRGSFLHATFATSLLAFAGFGAGTWAPSFLVRSHGMEVGIIGPALAAITILGAVPATIFAGRIADQWVRKDRRYHMWLPAFAMLSAVPFSIVALLLPAGDLTIFGLTVPSAAIVVGLFLIPTAANATYVGPFWRRSSRARIGPAIGGDETRRLREYCVTVIGHQRSRCWTKGQWQAPPQAG